MAQPSLSDLVVAAMVAPARCGCTRVVLVDGPAGSGKTTLAERLGTALKTQVLHADDMYEGWDGLPVLRDVLVKFILEPLSRGEQAGFERWDWAASARADRIEIPTGDVALEEFIEGWQGEEGNPRSALGV